MELNNDRYRVVERQPDGSWYLQRFADRQALVIQEQRLLEHYAQGEMVFLIGDQTPAEIDARIRTRGAPLKTSGSKKKRSVDLVDLPNGLTVPREQKEKLDVSEAIKRAKIVNEALKFTWGSADQIDAIDKAWRILSKKDDPETPPHYSTVFRWSQKLTRAGGNRHALKPLHHLKGRRAKPLSDAVQQMMEDVTEEHYLRREGMSIEALYRELKRRIQAQNFGWDEGEKLVIPAERRLKQYIKSLNSFDKFAARYGREAAIKKFRSVLSNVYARRPLERVELDATPLDLVVRGENGALLGRPYLHVCIDVCSRCVLGYSVSFEPPSLASLFECLTHAILPKPDAALRAAGHEWDWPYFGCFQRLVLDNALENHSDALHPLAAAWGMEIQFCPRRRPWYKGKIERFISTINHQLCHFVPGTTFSNILEKGEYNPHRVAVLDHRTFKVLVAKWMYMYHHKKHRTLGTTPAAQWKSAVQDEPVQMPADVRMIRQLARVPRIQRLTHKGIEREGLFWNSDDLTALRRELSAEMDVRVFFNHMNLETVAVEHPSTGALIEVPCLWREYATNLTLYQHKINRKRAREYLQAEGEEAFFEAERQIVELLEGAMAHAGYSSKRAARYKIGNDRRVRRSDSAPIIEAAPPTEPTPPPNSAPPAAIPPTDRCAEPRMTAPESWDDADDDIEVLYEIQDDVAEVH